MCRNNQFYLDINLTFDLDHFSQYGWQYGGFPCPHLSNYSHQTPFFNCQVDASNYKEIKVNQFAKLEFFQMKLITQRDFFNEINTGFWINDLMLTRSCHLNSQDMNISYLIGLYMSNFLTKYEPKMIFQPVW